MENSYQYQAEYSKKLVYDHELLVQNLRSIKFTPYPLYPQIWVLQSLGLYKWFGARYAPKLLFQQRVSFDVLINPHDLDSQTNK